MPLILDSSYIICSYFSGGIFEDLLFIPGFIKCYSNGLGVSLPYAEHWTQNGGLQSVLRNFLGSFI